MHSVRLSDGLCHFGSDYTFDSAGILRQSSRSLAGIYYIVQQQNAELVAGN